MTSALPILFLAQPWTLVLGGDIMLNGVSPNKKPFDSVAAVVSSATISIANLEVPLTSATTATPRKTRDEIQARTQYVLKADPKHIAHLQNAGFTYLALGNNHVMDYGPQGLNEMKALLDKAGIRYGGAGDNLQQANQLVVLHTKGTRVGVLSFLAFRSHTGRHKCWPATSRSAGVATLPFPGTIGNTERETLKQFVRNSKSRCDFLIVYLHWGVEGHTIPNDYQVALGRAWIDAGADLVVGSHPHVLQGAENYKGKLILYSLGDLVHSRSKKSGIARITYNATTLQTFELIPTRIVSGEIKPPINPNADFEAFEKLCSDIRTRWAHSDSRLPRLTLKKL